MDMRTGFATLATSAAVASFLLVFLRLQLTGLVLGMMAIASGISGFVLATSHQQGDRNLSVASVVLGIFATGLAVAVVLVL